MLSCHSGTTAFPTPFFVGVLAVLWTLPYLADRLLFDRLPGLASTLVFPCAWIAYEFIMAKTSPFGTWGTVAYTQYGNRPLMQFASVTGLAGISFLVTWFGPFVNYAWDRQFQGAQAASALIVYGVILGLVLLAGGARLAFSRYSKTVRVAVIGWPEGLVGMDSLMRVFTPKPLEDAEQPVFGQRTHNLLRGSDDTYAVNEACLPKGSEDVDEQGDAVHRKKGLVSAAHHPACPGISG